MEHEAFWWELAGKVGPPMLAGSIVASLVQDEFKIANVFLLVAGLLLMFAAHVREEHRR